MAVTIAGWLAIVAGAAVALLGLSLLVAFLSDRGVPVGGAGLFGLLTLGVGPLLMLSGIAVVIAGIKLMGGYIWARTILEIFSVIALCASVAWLIYSASQLRHIHSTHVFRGAVFFLFTGLPPILMMLLLRSDKIQRAMTR